MALHKEPFCSPPGNAPLLVARVLYPPVVWAHLVGTDTFQRPKMLVSTPGLGHTQGLEYGREHPASCQSPVAKTGQTLTLPHPPIIKVTIHLGSRRNTGFWDTDDNGIFGAGGITEKTNSKAGCSLRVHTTVFAVGEFHA